MKLIVTGATGFVGTEVIRQALRSPDVTSVVALARRRVEAPANIGSPSNTSKLHSVVLEDWTAPYPADVQHAIAGADACIWTLAVTPSASKEMPFEDVTRICADFTTHGLASMAAAATPGASFRFVYVSGVLIERDQSKELPFLGPYRHMRGRVETEILAFAAARAPHVQAAVVKPGGIDAPGREEAVSALMRSLRTSHGHEPRVHVSELAAAMLDMARNGAGDADTFSSVELAEAGKKLLGTDDYLT